MHTEIAAVATKARLQKSLVFTSLAHHINSTKLWDMLQKITPSTSAGIDRQTVKQAKEDYATRMKRDPYRYPQLRTGAYKRLLLTCSITSTSKIFWSAHMVDALGAVSIRLL